jgi:hypothetical protein
VIGNPASPVGIQVRSGAGTARLAAAALAALCLVAAQRAIGSEQEKPAEFKYAGGTEDVVEGCAGLLQLGPQSMAFRCAQYTVSIPYNSIELMQYRAGVSREVQRMKPKWKVRPSYSAGGKNRYFTVVYSTSGTPHVIVLDVPSGGMLPYLAEIDLKAGRRVDVQRHEDYE